MKEQAEIVCIIDRSGSMDKIVDDAIGGFNTFLKDQKELVNDDRMSVYFFDDKHEVYCEDKPIQEIEELTKETFVPRGFTALYDAIGMRINSLGEKLMKMDEADRPNKVIIMILTDGQENSSKEFDKEKIKEMIEHQTSVYKWEFMFLAANQDAFTGGSSMGIKNNFQFASTGSSMKSAFGVNTSAIKSIRKMSKELYDNYYASGESIYQNQNLKQDSSND